MAKQYGEAEPRNEGTTQVLPKDEARRRFKFHLVVGPDLFVWDAQAKEYLPDLMQLKLSPGIGGVGEKGECSHAIAAAQQKGRHVIFDGDHRLKIPGDPSQLLRDGRYRSRWIAATPDPKRGVFVYGWAWEYYDRVLGQVVFGQDSEMKRRFQRQILKAGILQPMSVEARRMKLRLAEARVHRYEAKDTGNIAIRRKLEAAEAVLADLRADYEKHAAEQTTERHHGEAEPVVVDGMVVEGDAA